MIFVQDNLKHVAVTDKDVLEVGSLDVNGTIRPLVEALKPKSYIGTDITEGKGVDLVCNARELKANSADFIISCEMLEHAQNWRSAMLGMYIALRDQGFLMLTTRSPGFGYHGYPFDFNRFTVNHMEEIIDAIGLRVISCINDPSSPGVFVIARKDDGNKPDLKALAAIEVPRPAGPEPRAYPPYTPGPQEVIFLGPHY